MPHGIYLLEDNEVKKPRYTHTKGMKFRNKDLCVIESCTNKKTVRGVIYCDEHHDKLVPKSTRDFEEDE